MRNFTSTPFFLASAFAFACGGAIDTGLLDGGTSGDGSSTSDGATKDGAPIVDAGGPSCTDLINQLNALQADASACCPTCNVSQCTAQVDGLCCPLTVNSKDSDAVKSYEAILQQIDALKCAVNCPALACSSKPTATCTQSGTCAQ